MFVYSYPLLFLLLTGFCGLGAAALALPPGLRRYTFHFAPWFGISYLGAVVYFCYLFDLPGTDFYARWLLVPPLILALWALYRRFRSRRVVRWMNREFWLSLVPFVTAVTLFGALYFRAAHFPTSISIGNNDISFYSFTAALVKEYARSAALPLWGPIHANPPLLLADANWSTPAYLIAVAGSLFHYHPYEIATLTINALFALTVLIFYPFCRRMGLGRSQSVWLGIVYAVSPLLGNVVLNGLMGEVVAIGFLLMAVAVSRSAAVWRWKLVVLFGVVFLGLLFAYAIVIPMVIIAIFVVGGIDVAIARNWRAVVCLVYGVVLSLIYVLLLSEERVHEEVRGLLQLTGATTGWFVPWLSPATLLGYFNPPPLHLYALPLAVIFMIAVAMAIFLPGARRRPAVSLLVVGYLGFYLLISWLGRESGHGLWGGYKSFKFATFLFPLFLAASGVLFYRAGEERPRFKIAFPLLCGLALCGAVISDLCEWWVMPKKLVLTEGLMGLRSVNARTDVASVTVPDFSPWEMAWIGELLESKHLYVPLETMPDVAIATNWDLLRLNQGMLIKERQLFTIWTGMPHPGDLVRVNSDFGLRRHLDSPVYSIFPDHGWWIDERDFRWTGSVGSEAGVNISSYRDGVKVKVSYSVELLPSEMMQVEFEEHEVDSITSGGPHTLELTLHSGANELLFRSSFPPTRRAPKDSRTLGMKFTQWTVEVE